MKLGEWAVHVDDGRVHATGCCFAFFHRIHDLSLLFFIFQHRLADCCVYVECSNFQKKVTVFRHHQICQLTWNAIASLQRWLRTSLNGQKKSRTHIAFCQLALTLQFSYHKKTSRKRMREGNSCACEYCGCFIFSCFCMNEKTSWKKHRKGVKHYIGLCRIFFSIPKIPAQLGFLPREFTPEFHLRSSWG